MASERAGHWLAAGPEHSARAWRAAVAAADEAERLHSHQEAAAWLERARRVQAAESDATVEQRLELLLRLAAEHRLTGQGRELTEVVEAAIGSATELGDLEASARAATARSIGSFWQTGHYGAFNQVVVDALRRCVERRDALAPATACLVLLALANETYYVEPYERRRELCEEALARARKIGDPVLLAQCLLLAVGAVWTRASVRDRAAMAREAVRLAEAAADGAVLVAALTQLAMVESELGATSMWQTIGRARREARRRKLLYALLVLDNTEQSWHAMAGRFEEAAALTQRIASTAARMEMPQSREAAHGAALALAVWQRDARALAEPLAAILAGPLPATWTTTLLLLRTGQTAAARGYLADHPQEWPTDSWFAPLVWCAAAEVAAELQLPEAARRAYALLRPLAGQNGCAGAGLALGPVDAFLALAASAEGEIATARRHAEDAAALMTAWDLPLAARRWAAQRLELGL